MARTPELHESLIAKCQSYTDDAVKALVDILTNPKASPTARVRAATVILDRGHGKAPDTPPGASSDPSMLTDGDILREVKGIVAKAKAKTHNQVRSHGTKDAEVGSEAKWSEPGAKDSRRSASQVIENRLDQLPDSIDELL